MIATLTSRPLILAAAVMLAAHSSAQTTAFDPVTALEQAVQLADIQNDPVGAKDFLEKLTGPEIPAKIREQAKARLAKMNPTIELNLGPGVKAFDGFVQYDNKKNPLDLPPKAAPLSQARAVLVRVDPNEVLTHVLKVRLNAMEPSAKEWLVSRGVVFDEGASAVFNTSTKSLVVKNKRSELDKVAAILDQLSRPAPERISSPVPQKLAKQLEQIIAKIDVKDAPAEAALKQISEQSSIAFHYKPGTSNASLTLQLKSVPASVAINYVAELANLEVSYHADGVHLGARGDSTPRPTAEARLTEAMNLLMTSGADDRSVLVDAAIDGMAKSLSPHGEYRSENDDRAFQTAMQHNLVGIGAMLGGGKVITIQQVVRGSPAERAGLTAGLEIADIDGRTPFALGSKLDKIVAAIRGAAGTTVTLRLKAPDGTLRTVEIVRETIPLDTPTVTPIGSTSTLWVKEVDGDTPVSKADLDKARSWWVDKNAGIAGVAIKALTPKLTAEVRAALETPELKEEPLRGLIIDLTFNGGGSLDEAVGVADLFLNNGVVVTSKYADKEDVKSATAGEMLAGVPIVVLVNGGTASGAEVIAAALQDHHRATIIGRRTYGKGEVMTLKTLKSGGSIKTPLAELLRASGKGLERREGMSEPDDWGVTPDIIAGEESLASDVPANRKLMVEAALAHFKTLDAKK